MKFHFILPLSALLVLIIFSVLVEYQLIPSGLSLLELMQNRFSEHLFILLAVIILLESIVYIGFYFPGQFFAVVLVVLAKPDWQDFAYLTCAMVSAATLGSAINYLLGRYTSKVKVQGSTTSMRSLLLAMIHINSLAFFMFAQGAKGQSFKIVWLAGLLNLPYYLLLVIATSLLSQQVLYVAENTWLLIAVIALWLGYAVAKDLKQLRASAPHK